MYLFGGFDGTRLNDVYKINIENIKYDNDTINYKSNKVINENISNFFNNLETFKWVDVKPKNNEIFTARTGHCSCIVNNKIYVFGGTSKINSNEGENLRKNDLFSFDLSSHKWICIDDNGQKPSNRSGSKVV